MYFLLKKSQGKLEKQKRTVIYAGWGVHCVKVMIENIQIKLSDIRILCVKSIRLHDSEIR